MALSPDVIVEVAFPLPCLSQPVIDDIANQVESAFFSGLPLSPPSPQAVCAENTNVTPNANVLTIGLWMEADGFTDAQRLDALVASSFISGNHTADLFFSTALIQYMARTSWASIQKHQGSITLSNTIDVNVSSAGIVTKVSGTYDVPVLPDISFTDTITETLALNPPGDTPALRAHTSHQLDVSQADILEDSLLIGLISPILGGLALLGGEIAAGNENPQASGVGSSLANSWPTVLLTSQPFVGKVTFGWTDLAVNASGVRTQGAYGVEPRSPQVTIDGPTAVSFPETHSGATESYSLELTDLRPKNATVVWGGVAQGAPPGMGTSVTFTRTGDFTIRASVTDTDNVSATGQKEVTVTVTHGKGEPP